MQSKKQPRVLIANRGAIAVRIIRTLKSMQIESVAVYAESDYQSLHVRRADHAVSLGEGNATSTYLNADRIIEIALSCQVDAIHPGYGFLSENTDFVKRCDQHGIKFIGPTSDQIDAFGLKVRARTLADQHDVPLLPGSKVLSSVQDALTHADRIGYPVMLKSTAGGGGIGMRLCGNADELDKHYDNVSELSRNSFANADLFLEKYVEQARHIEVQIFGDGKGNVVSLGERDCSAQRRNQKVIEETPAANLPEATRDKLQTVACRLAAAVNYRNAGTVEFILDAASNEFYFLEVNTRLQVEHGVTEMVYGIDIVKWMVELSLYDNPLPATLPQPSGHSIQARVYAEDPARNFQPSAGLVSSLTLPESGPGVRIDHWIEAGTPISTFYDPMLAKVIVHAETRDQAINKLDQQLGGFSLYGVETNIEYLRHLLSLDAFNNGQCLTSTVGAIRYKTPAIEVIQAGTLTTVQDFPGRSGYWSVGIPPSGPFDDLSFRRGNRLLGNPENAAGLEMTLDGVELYFRLSTRIVIAGAAMCASLDGRPMHHGNIIDIATGQTLKIDKIDGEGLRGYLLIAGGLECPAYLGSRSTFTLGKFGGHNGRALRNGDVLRVCETDYKPATSENDSSTLPALPTVAEIHVITGPHGTTEFFDQSYLEEFYSCTWKVHFNSSRTGIRLVGPKPVWTRETGGEAGMHPSNLHDNAYAFGTIDFTGDMPVILGPDGPSLGGFVCPATVATADRWKLGQLKAGDEIKFVPVTRESAVKQLAAKNQSINSMQSLPDEWVRTDVIEPWFSKFTIHATDQGLSQDLEVVIRRASDSFLLIEFGERILDLELRFVVQQLLVAFESEETTGLRDLTPGIRSLQVHFDCLQVAEEDLVRQIERLCRNMFTDGHTTMPSRIVHLPLSWDDEQCKLAIEKYDQVVRKDAPWYPSNIEFIRRINGLDSIEEVKKIVFEANYLVMGLGDVYLGAPVATPLDPRHRLVTTKYNPARTWTAENSVGIGGSYLCIYGMEGPGGYQFVGRTLQMWNVYHQTREFTKPWLLRFFDQIKFYPVSQDELHEIRQGFLIGECPIRIEETELNLADYKQFVKQHRCSIQDFSNKRQQAFDTELDHWKATGQYQFEDFQEASSAEELPLKAGVTAEFSPAAGSVWKLLVKPGQTVEHNQAFVVLESMKMEIEVFATHAGVVDEIFCDEGTMVDAGSRLLTLRKEKT